MLQNSFIHLHGVGPITEGKLWARGITSWEGFLRRRKRPLGPRQTRQIRRGLETSQRELERRNHRYFRRRLPFRESWRAFREFGDSVAYLDIETTGRREARDQVTIIGLYDGTRFRSYVGANLEQFPEDIGRFQLLVTFNGACFDLPFLRRAFPGLQFHQIHIDLRFVMAQLGMGGGLKAVERRLGLGRTPRTQHLHGLDAVHLWRRYQRGDGEALEVLLEYNMEDAVNLKPILELAYARLRSEYLGHGFLTYSLRDFALPPEVTRRPGHGTDRRETALRSRGVS